MFEHDRWRLQRILRLAVLLQINLTRCLVQNTVLSHVCLDRHLLLLCFVLSKRLKCFGHFNLFFFENKDLLLEGEDYLILVALFLDDCLVDLPLLFQLFGKLLNHRRLITLLKAPVRGTV